MVEALRTWPAALACLLALSCEPSAEEPVRPPAPRAAAQQPAVAQGVADDGAWFRPEDPRWKQVRIASSEDGLHWAPMAREPVVGASSPQLVSVGGQLRVYYVDAGRSIAWVPFEGGAPTPVTISGLEGGIQVDPCLVELPGGGFRLFLLHHAQEGDPAFLGGGRVLSASSPDGDAWELESGVRLEGDWVDPDLVLLPDGGARMYLTLDTRSVRSALASDGLSFEIEEGERFYGGGVTSTLLDQGTWWLYFQEAGTLWRARSADGERFAEHEPLSIPQPGGGRWMLESPAVLRDGERWLMAYVTAPTEARQVVSPSSSGGQ